MKPFTFVGMIFAVEGMYRQNLWMLLTQPLLSSAPLFFSFFFLFFDVQKFTIFSASQATSSSCISLCMKYSERRFLEVTGMEMGYDDSKNDERWELNLCQAAAM